MSFVLSGVNGDSDLSTHRPRAGKRAEPPPWEPWKLPICDLGWSGCF
jgi:hypothetical protein